MRAKLLLGMLAILWIGMILAVGMESVVKFDAPSLSRAAAFDEGRYVFHFFNYIEFILLALMCILIFNPETDFWEKSTFVVISVVLVIQVYWLFPMLSQHVDLIVAGIKPPHSYAHAVFGWLEVIKLALLSVLGFRLLLVFGR